MALGPAGPREVRREQATWESEVVAAAVVAVVVVAVVAMGRVWWLELR